MEEETGELIQLVITYEVLEDDAIYITGYRNDEELCFYESIQLSSWQTGDAEIFFGNRNGSKQAGGPGGISADIEEARIYSGVMALDKIEELLEEGPVKLKDEDKDGLPDEWEKDHFKNLAKGAEDDPDDDNLTNLTELKLRTNPNKKDTDDDTLPDDVETNSGEFVDSNDTGTNPLKADTDDDGLADNIETNTGKFVGVDDTGTDPLNPNTDDDLVKDGQEVSDGSDPNDSTDPPVDPNKYLVGHWTFEGETELEDLTGNFPELLLQ